jgi:hypothetical protein
MGAVMNSIHMAGLSLLSFVGVNVDGGKEFADVMQWLKFLIKVSVTSSFATGELCFTELGPHMVGLFLCVWINLEGRK